MSALLLVLDLLRFDGAVCQAPDHKMSLENIVFCIKNSLRWPFFVFIFALAATLIFLIYLYTDALGFFAINCVCVNNSSTTFKLFIK